MDNILENEECRNLIDVIEALLTGRNVYVALAALTWSIASVSCFAIENNLMDPTFLDGFSDVIKDAVEDFKNMPDEEE